MPYSAKAVANYFLDLAERAGGELSPMKLQKLVYYAHGWHLAIKNEPLVHEQVEAWTWGPVIPSLYRDLKHYGNGPVREKLRSFRIGSDGALKRFTPTIGDKTDPNRTTRALLKKVWDTYSKYTAIQLSNLTHAKGSPWHQVFKEYDGSLPLHTDIPRETIRAYFVDRARDK